MRREPGQLRGLSLHQVVQGEQGGYQTTTRSTNVVFLTSNDENLDFYPTDNLHFHFFYIFMTNLLVQGEQGG